MTEISRAGADAAPDLNTTVTGQDRRTLDGIFRHPLAHNLAWREVLALFRVIGGAEEKANGDLVFSAGGEHMTVKSHHTKDLTGQVVIDLRHLLTHAGWSASGSAPSAADAPSQPHRLIVVIDHAGARIYRIEQAGGGKDAVVAHDPKHVPHHLEHGMHDADRDETDPEDERFFDRIVDAVSSGGEIVVIGHGKGQSNEADHLSSYLKGHHSQTYARIVREIVADIPHLTTPELLRVGLDAFG
jgi:hypothetical protein